MRLSDITTRADFRTLLLLWLVLVLLVAVVNVPFALTRIRSRTSPRPPTTVDLRGADAAAMDWPITTPHADAWPEPNYYLVSESFGNREYHVMAPGQNDEGNGFSTQVQHMGWPLPVIEIKQMWWDWNNAALSGPEPDPSPGLLLRGLIGNPLVLGSAAFLIVGLLPYTGVLVRRAWRVRGGDCIWCGYHIGDMDACPECGRAPTRSAGPPSDTSRPRSD